MSDFLNRLEFTTASNGVVVHDNMSQMTRYLAEFGVTPSFIPFNTISRRF